MATHEFGHSLGLEHTDVTTAVMHPIHEYSSDFKLDKDDIEGIQVHWTKMKIQPFSNWSNSFSPLMIHLKRNLGIIREESVQQEIGAWIRRYVGINR